MADTVADVFIIESLDPDDEGNGRFEGAAICHILRLHDKNPKYCYVRTKKDFQKALSVFKKSRYRYLHLSAHADADGPCTTNQENISYEEIADDLFSAMDGRRIFISACGMVHEKMAKTIIQKTDCVSIVGPKDNIAFADAAVFWPAVYHLMFSKSGAAIKHADLQKGLKEAALLFGIDISYFSRSKKLKRGYTIDLLKRR